MNQRNVRRMKYFVSTTLIADKICSGSDVQEMPAELRGYLRDHSLCGVGVLFNVGLEKVDKSGHCGLPLKVLRKRKDFS